jgi:hypothetical protein
MIKALILIMMLIFVNSIPAGTIDPFNEDSKYIEHSEKFIHTYKICGTYKDNSLFCASATAINNHWFLTAAHIVKNSRTCLIHKNDKAYEVKKIIIHEDFSDENFGKADIALCYVEENIGLDSYPELYDSDDEIGKTCSISGYGMTGTFDTGAKVNDMKHRAGTNKIDSITSNLLLCSSSKPTDQDRTSLEFLIGSGDSGGGLYINDKLAGVNSCVLAADKKPDSSYGDESGHTRISKFVGWIKEVIR